jgi:hypothetical protein
LKNRDFVDFVIELVGFKKLFFSILFLVFSLALYYQANVNNKYKFSEEISVSSQFAYVEILEFVNTIKKKPEGILDKPFEEFYTFESAKKDICALISNAVYTQSFREDMIKKYLNTFKYNGSNKKLGDMIIASIKTKGSKNSCTTFVITGEIDFILFMKEHFIYAVSQQLDSEIVGTYDKMRAVKLRGLNEGLQYAIDNNLDSSLTLQHKINILNSFDLSKGKMEYFEFNESDVFKQMPILFVGALAFFLSIIIFVFSVIILDFRSQYIEKRNMDS